MLIRWEALVLMAAAAAAAIIAEQAGQRPKN